MGAGEWVAGYGWVSMRSSMALDRKARCTLLHSPMRACAKVQGCSPGESWTRVQF